MGGTRNGALQLVVIDFIISKFQSIHYNINWCDYSDACGAASPIAASAGEGGEFPPLLQAARGGRVGRGRRLYRRHP